MSTEIKVPAFGESITSGLLSAWLKQNGDLVEDGEPLLSIETDKISSDVPAPAGGRLVIQTEAGQEVQIGQVVGLLEAVTEGSKSEPTQAKPSEESAATTPAEPKPPSSVPPAIEEKPLSPAVRRLVQEEKVPVDQVQGTGKGGLVTKGDVMGYLESREKKTPPPAAAEQAVTSVPPSVSTPAAEERFTRRKMSPLRRKIAAQLVLAQQNAAMLTTFNECDMTAVIALRSQYQESFQKRHGVKLGFMSFFIKAAVEALQTVPAVNARIDGDDLIENHYFDIGVAVGTEKGLVVPIVRDPDRKSFAELEKAVGGYAAKAREGKLQLDELTSGVFTITNGGIYGSLLSTPILNPPQSGILGMHKIQNRPVAIGDKIEIRPMMYLALSYDHRAVDGKEAVTFLVRIKECIEDPTRLLLQG
jgi:2-oxoglutarate dehydrogenase E2 component (dihydrolipoamide succinyltransferase)